MITAKHTDHERDFQRHIYKALAAGAAAWIVLGTIVYSALEEWSYVDSLYFSVVTVTTVGFGDLAPDTDGAKLFTVAYIVLGVSIVATYLDARMKRHAYNRATRHSQD